MTEEDAKTKYCPTGAAFDYCQGAACMAWRWTPGARVFRLNQAGEKTYSFTTSDARQFENDPTFAIEPNDAGGFCGLAGATA